MIYESSPSIEASQGSNYSTKSENAKDLNLDKCQKVFEALGLSPLKKEKVEDSAYVSKKIASATGEMYKNMNMQPPAFDIEGVIFCRPLQHTWVKCYNFFDERR